MKVSVTLIVLRKVTFRMKSNVYPVLPNPDKIQPQLRQQSHQFFSKTHTCRRLTINPPLETHVFVPTHTKTVPSVNFLLCELKVGVQTTRELVLVVQPRVVHV